MINLASEYSYTSENASSVTLESALRENAELREFNRKLEAQISSQKKDFVQNYSDACYWKALHKRSIEKQTRLKQEYDAKIAKFKKQSKEQLEKREAKINKLEAKVRLREQQLFGKKSEKTKKIENKAKPSDDKQKRKRGKKKGSKGHGRKKYPKLSKIEELISLSEDDQVCPSCNEPYQEINSTQDSEIVEVKVKAYIRVIRRKCYKRGCKCCKSPIIKTAPPAPRLIWKSPFGVSVWVELLLGKFWFGSPSNRTITNLSSLDFNISPGSIVGGFYQLEKFLRPIYDAIVAVNVKEKQWHADETRWSVFEPVEGKGNYRWYLWVFKGLKTVVFLLDPTRATKVIQGHLGEEAEGTIICDRYSAYKCFARIIGGKIVLAYCWAHVRRDFLDLAKKYPAHESWGMKWVERIGNLYYLNKSRLKYDKETPEFVIANESLKKAIEDFKKTAESERKDLEDGDPRNAVLASFFNHSEGLIVFVNNPDIPMDNNSGERAIRGPVVGRKNYYGSGSKQSAHFSTMMFTIIHTLLLNKINPRKWLSWFFEECTIKQDSIFSEISRFLPWNLSHDEVTRLGFDQKEPESFNSS